jgi:hypothetical protein
VDPAARDGHPDRAAPGARPADGPLGPRGRARRRGRARARPPGRAWLAAPGAELPVVVDPQDATRAAFDWPAAAEEARDRAGTLADPPPDGSVAAIIAADRAAPAESTMSASPATIALPEAGDPAVAPIEGVTLEMWAAVEAGVARDRVAPADLDAYAQRHGVPAGRWPAVSAAWQARMMSDWRVGARMGEAVEAAKRRR